MAHACLPDSCMSCRLVRPMLQQAEAIAGDMDALALASTIAAIGRLKLKADGLLDRLLGAALPLLHNFDAKVRMPAAHYRLNNHGAARALERHLPAPQRPLHI